MRNGKRLDSDRRPPTDTFGAFRKPPFNNMDAIICSKSGSKRVAPKATGHLSTPPKQLLLLSTIQEADCVCTVGLVTRYAQHRVNLIHFI